MTIVGGSHKIHVVPFDCSSRSSAIRALVIVITVECAMSSTTWCGACCSFVTCRCGYVEYRILHKLHEAVLVQADLVRENYNSNIIRKSLTISKYISLASETNVEVTQSSME